MRSIAFALLTAAGLLAAPLAHAEDHPAPPPAATSHRPAAHQPPAKTPSHADPATKKLPTTASAIAKQNAFGQQGARMRAAHQAARAAAAAQAKQAAAEHHRAVTRGPNGHANAHASAAGSRGAQGLAHAAAARGAHGRH